MYNLLVTFTKGAWQRGAYEYQRGRVIGGYGDEDLAARYKDLSQEAIAELTSIPSLFMYEEGVGDEVYVGRLTAIKPRSTTVRIEFEVKLTLPKTARAEVTKLGAELDFGRFALSHTHWAVKDVDLLRALAKARLLTQTKIDRLAAAGKLVSSPAPRSEVQVRPAIFRIPPGPVEQDLVSVMMPFEGTFTAVFKAIESACKMQSLRCLRADNIWDEAEVIQDIFSLIYRSRIVVCDFTKRNPNVFYEAGIAHTLGRLVIPIVQHADDIPFDLRHLRYVQYLNNTEGRGALAENLSAKFGKVVAG